MSRSLRQHQPQREGIDAFPTPSSSGSTPPTMATPPIATDDLSPPRKRARYNPPTDPVIVYRTATPSDIETAANTDEETTLRVPRIRIKMAAQDEQRSSVRHTKMNHDEMDYEDEDNSQESVDKEESWEDHEICEMVDPQENWRVIGLSNVGNTCFTNAVLQVFSQTEILGDYFIQRYVYIPPSLKAITNPFTSADLSSRSSRSKTRRNQASEQEIPALSSKTLCSSFSRLLRALHPSIAPPIHRLGVTYHQPKKHRSDSKYTIAPREFLGTFNSIYPSFRKGESQEDAMEFFSKVRERLHDELRADLELRLHNSGDEIDSNEQWIYEKTPISDIFRGYYVTKRMCTICNTARDAQLEETWQLPVAVPSSITPALQTYALADLIAHYGGVEKDVNVECRQCGGNTPHDSRPSYLQTPRVLVIQALRFLVPKTPLSTTILDTESTTGTDSPTDYSSEPLAAPKRKRRPTKRKVVKNPAHITFPLTELDMTSYLRTPSAEEELYDLFAVVEHVGRRMDGGHYIAYIRGKDGAGKDCWWKCNDAKCWIVNSETVSAAQGYIWFYERRTQRGVIPEDWGEVLPVEPEREVIPAAKNSMDGVGLATPESDERPLSAGAGWEDAGRKTDGSWEGRLRRTSA